MTVRGTSTDLEMLEIASGAVLGNDASIPEPRKTRTPPRQMFEQVLVAALAKPPCGVSFSGGRDSSAVLAAAAEAAHKVGLPAPVPVTLRFPGIEGTDESSYQEMVVRHLGLRDWVILQPGRSLDVMGKLATSLTRRHGLLYPANIHFHVPIFEALGGGTVMTGLGGDEILGANSNHELAAMLHGKRPPTQALMRQFVKRYILRERVRNQVRRDHTPHLPWLAPDARHELIERLVDWLTQDYLWADRQLTASTYRMRYLHRAKTDMAQLGTEFAVDVVHPYLDPDFVGAVAGRLGRVGLGSRKELMELLFGDLLPQELIERTSKAWFNGVFWTSIAQETVETLPIDRVPDLVDPQALLAFWRSEEQKGATYLIAKYLRSLVATGEPTSPAR